MGSTIPLHSRIFRLATRSVSRFLLPATAACLALLAVLPYLRAYGFGFILLDDESYLLENFRVRGGLTLDGVGWAFSAFHSANWHPLTWISHMIDVSLFGISPGPHHVVNVLLHSVNTVLLFLLLAGMTGSLPGSAAAAALFAAHPLHVESVAWVSERKDLLCALFFLLAVIAYWRYARKGGAARYLGVVLSFALALLSKPMAVTLPFVLLLLDFWPLGRMGPIRRLLAEKIPLLAMSAASSVVTLAAQGSEGAIDRVIPFGQRMLDAATSYAAYLGKTAWPSDLAVFYPYRAAASPNGFPWEAAGAFLLLAAVTAAALAAARRAPFLCTGWLWFLGTLVPVIGLVHAGSQAMADRYAYLPSVGLFLALAWGAPSLLPRFRGRSAVLGIAAGTVVSVLAAVSYVQAGYWKDSVSLFTRAMSVTRDNWLAHSILGYSAAREGNLGEAKNHLRETLRIRPDYTPGMVILGNVMLSEGRIGEAESLYRNAIRVRPSESMAHYNLGRLLAMRGMAAEAILEYEEARRRSPDDPRILVGLGTALLQRGDLPAAIRKYREADRLSPGNPVILYDLGAALAEAGNVEEAIRCYRASLERNPGNGKAHNNLGKLLEKRGNAEEAMREYRSAVLSAPGDYISRMNLGFSLVRAGRGREAAGHFREALRIRQGDPEAARALRLALQAGGA